jgi:hypothetical protein
MQRTIFIVTATTVLSCAAAACSKDDALLGCGVRSPSCHPNGPASRIPLRSCSALRTK